MATSSKSTSSTSGTNVKATVKRTFKELMEHAKMIRNEIAHLALSGAEAAISTLEESIKRGMQEMHTAATAGAKGAEDGASGANDDEGMGNGSSSRGGAKKAGGAKASAGKAGAKKSGAAKSAGSAAGAKGKAAASSRAKSK
ncbi:hypothetical protein BH11PLA1_BH11PLA1_15630 [soil metagenome]